MTDERPADVRDLADTGLRGSPEPRYLGLDPSEGPAPGGWTVTPGLPDPTVSAARPRPWRWWVAMAVTVVVVGAVAGAGIAITRGAGTSPTLGYVPSNAIVYAEGRLDAPGDQGIALASFLSHFPGFSDTSNLETKLDDTWDRLLAAVPGNPFTYSADVAPWIQGTIGIAVLPEPRRRLHVRLHLSPLPIRTRRRPCSTSSSRRRARRATSPTRTTIAGATEWTFRLPARGLGVTSGAPAGRGEGSISVALLPGTFVAASDPATIGTLLDVKAGRVASLEGSQAYRDATAGAAASDLAAVYVSTDALERDMQAPVSRVATASPVASRAHRLHDTGLPGQCLRDRAGGVGSARGRPASPGAVRRRRLSPRARRRSSTTSLEPRWPTSRPTTPALHWPAC